MRHNIHKALLFLAVLAGVLVLAITALAQSGGGYDLSWNTFDGGGGASSGGSYDLGGTGGQPDAGSQSGGSYDLQSGFWGGISPSPTATATPGEPDYWLYLPAIANQ